MKKSVRIGISTCILCLLALTFYLVYGNKPYDGRLRISVLDIGQGDSILIRTPNDTRILIDSGPDRSIVRKLEQQLPFFDTRIDMMIVTHPDKDHIAGFEYVLEKFELRTIVDNNLSKHTAESQRVRSLEKLEKDAKIIQLYTGSRLRFSDGVLLTILNPKRGSSFSEINNYSVTVRLDYKQQSFLFTGDLDATGEMKLISDTSIQPLVDVDVLKIGHHGSRYSSSLAFLRAVSPKLGLVSYACSNNYGHPAPATVRRFTYFHIPVYNTCDSGTITYVTNGTDFQVETEK